MPGSGRRRQAAVPLRRRMRLDLLLWGVLAGTSAAVVLGLTGGGWTRALVLGLLVVAGFAVLTGLNLLTATGSRRRPGRSEPPPPPSDPQEPS